MLACYGAVRIARSAAAGDDVKRTCEGKLCGHVGLSRLFEFAPLDPTIRLRGRTP